MKQRDLKKAYSRIVMLLLSAVTALMFILQSPILVKAVPICENGEHQYSVEIIKQKTDDEDGEVRYTCDICGYSYTEVLPATGHHWGEWIVDKAPACGQDGHKHCVCATCGAVKEETIPKLSDSHKFVQSIISEPTYTKTGLRKYKCSICGYEYTQTIPMLKATTTIKQTTSAPVSTAPATTAAEPTSADSVTAVTGNKSDYTAVGSVSEITESTTAPAAPAEKNTEVPSPNRDARPSIDINALDVVLPTATLAYGGVVMYILWFNYLIILWDRKKRKENKEKREQCDNEQLD